MPRDLPVDLLNNYSRETVFRRKNASTFKKLAKTTHFSYREVEALAIIHRKIVETKGPMNRYVFHDIYHAGLDLTNNKRHLLIDRIFSTFDKSNSLQINYVDWVEGMSVVLRGTLDERIRFAFSVYDYWKTNKLNKENIFQMLRGCIFRLPENEDTEQAVKDLVELLLKKIDVDRDGFVSDEDFAAAVRKNPLYLECMGPVFPTRPARQAFLNTFTDTPTRY
ncbi:calaxin-like [Prorops nasuta]|uniref:calaxin-like n=1 Tax=Prorops nasuta TaxID=863751 RepID=UPI0034CD9332